MFMGADPWRQRSHGLLMVKRKQNHRTARVVQKAKGEADAQSMSSLFSPVSPFSPYLFFFFHYSDPFATLAQRHDQIWSCKTCWNWAPRMAAMPGCGITWLQESVLMFSRFLVWISRTSTCILSLFFVCSDGSWGILNGLQRCIHMKATDEFFSWIWFDLESVSVPDAEGLLEFENERKMNT